MPVDPAINAPSTSVLAYNGDHPRGWNDPPTFAFSSQKGGGSRPKLDLRKRVSHQQALHGTRTPPSMPTTSTSSSSYSGGTDVSDRMASLSLQPALTPTSPPTTSHPSHTTTPPVQPKASHISHTATPPVPLYAPPMTHSYSSHETRSHSLPSVLMTSISPVPTFTPHTCVAPTMPSMSLPREQVRNPSPAPMADTPTHLGQPLFALKDHSFEPVKTHNESGVRSTAEIGDHLDDQQPDIFHPTPYPVSNGFHPCATIVPSIPNVEMSLGAHSKVPSVGHITPPPPPGHVSPIAPRAHIEPPSHVSPIAPSAHIKPHRAPGIVSPGSYLHGGAGHGVGPSNTESQTQPPLVDNLATHPLGHSLVPSNLPQFPPPHRSPPPPHSTPLVHLAPGSLSTGSTPRCLSPEQNGVDDGSVEMGDEEGLKATMEALKDVIQKYNLEKRACDDIQKRLQVMSKMWMNGKLGKTVKSRMIKLAKALDDGLGEEAHQIHVRLMVDHVAEVNQWMVGVKRLISLVRNNTERAASS